VWPKQTDGSYVNRPTKYQTKNLHGAYRAHEAHGPSRQHAAAGGMRHAAADAWAAAAAGI